VRPNGDVEQRAAVLSIVDQKKEAIEIITECIRSTASIIQMQNLAVRSLALDVGVRRRCCAAHEQPTLANLCEFAGFRLHFASTLLARPLLKVARIHFAWSLRVDRWVGPDEGRAGVSRSRLSFQGRMFA